MFQFRSKRKMESFVISIIITLFASGLIAPVCGFLAGGTTHCVGPQPETLRPLSKQRMMLNPLSSTGDGFRAQLPDTSSCFSSNTRSVTMSPRTLPSKTTRGHWPSQLLSSVSPTDLSPSRAKTTAVYALILVSLLSFVGDNILHMPVFRTMYLYHRSWRWWQPITSMFCHGDRAHLSGNVFLLLLFGRSVEDELGSNGLVFSYIFCGLFANLVSLVMLPRNTVSLGASGAVFGLFTVSIFSRLSWRDILDWRKIIEVGVLGQFVVTQFLNEAKTAASGGIVGINHVAHLSGAAAGVGMILILRKLIDVLEKGTRK